MDEEYWEEIPDMASVVQHPSTPTEIQNPTELVEMCLQDIFVPAIQVISGYDFDIHDEKFQQYLPVVVNCLRAVLLDQRGIHHPLIDAFQESK